MKINNKKNLILLLTAFIGLIVSLELCLLYYKANFLTDIGPSFCTVNDVIDCDATARSPYSVFMGIPLSLWGVFYYAFTIGLIAFPFEKFKIFQNFKNPISYVFVLSLFGVVFSFILLLISSLIINKICILCSILYFINIIMFALSKIGTSISTHINRSFNDLKNIFSEKIWILSTTGFLIIGIIILATINITGVFIPPQKSISIHQPPKYRLPLIGNTLGDKDAKLIIKEFTDYECQFCAISIQMLHRITREIDGIRVELYNFPLNQECNSLIDTTIHHHACTAIYYAEAARKQGKFWDLTLLMYKNQRDLNEENIIKLARSIGLNIEKLQKDAQDPAIKEKIANDIEKAKRFHIKGTPTHIIGIKKYEGIEPYHKLKRKILNAL